MSLQTKKQTNTNKNLTASESMVCVNYRIQPVSAVFGDDQYLFENHTKPSAAKIHLPGVTACASFNNHCAVNS
jgi:hypothetical protein